MPMSLPRPKRAPEPATLDSIATELQKLNRHVDSLAKAVSHLQSRFKGRYKMDGSGGFERAVHLEPNGSSPAEIMLAAVRSTDLNIAALEYHFRAIRATLAVIADDSYLREEFKEFLVCNGNSKY